MRRIWRKFCLHNNNESSATTNTIDEDKDKLLKEGEERKNQALLGRLQIVWLIVLQMIFSIGDHNWSSGEQINLHIMLVLLYAFPNDARMMVVMMVVIAVVVFVIILCVAQLINPALAKVLAAFVAWWWWL